MQKNSQRLTLAALYALAILAAALILFKFPPGPQYRFYPRCALFSMTGWKCPGCGGLRATHQLLHGNFASAWRLNPLIFFILPTLLSLLAVHVFWLLTGRSLSNPLQRPAWLWGLVVGSVLFGALRNFF